MVVLIMRDYNILDTFVVGTGSARGTKGPQCSQEHLLWAWQLLRRSWPGPHVDGARPRVVEGRPGRSATPSAGVDARGVTGCQVTTTTLVLPFGLPFVGAGGWGSRTGRAADGHVG
jgi:hypothetical protein